MLLAAAIFIAAFGSAIADAQVAAGGNFSLEQSVIASGGRQNMTGGAFSFDGTSGQAAAGNAGRGAAFGLYSGFWTTIIGAPTAANVTVGGRITTANGRGIRNVRGALTNAQGETRVVLSGAFGYYRFADVAAGETYILIARSKHFEFANAVQVINVTEDATEIDFVAFE